MLPRSHLTRSTFDLSSEPLRDTVIRLFLAARATPGADYDPDRFLAFLTDPPAQTGPRVADSFAGRRRFVRFLEAVQLSCGVCFSNEDWDRGVSFEDFVHLVETKAAKPAYGSRLARDRVRSAKAHLTGDPVKFGLLSFPLLAGAIVGVGTTWSVLLGALWLGITGGVAFLALRTYRYYQRLVAVIEQRRLTTA